MSKISEFILRQSFKPLRKYVEKHALPNVLTPLLGYQPINTVYDIGARRGDWSRALKPVLRDAHFVLFEATTKYATEVERDFPDCFFEVLSDEIKEVDFYSNNSAGDSYYKESSANFEGVAPKKVVTNTLDNLIKTQRIPYADFIKVDTQGAELDILRGGHDALKHASYVMLELSLVELNLGAPNIYQALDFMRLSNFFPHEIIEFHRHPLKKVLNQIDILFLSERLLNKLASQVR